MWREHACTLVKVSSVKNTRDLAQKSTLLQPGNREQNWYGVIFAMCMTKLQDTVMWYHWAEQGRVITISKHICSGIRMWTYLIRKGMQFWEERITNTIFNLTWGYCVPQFDYSTSTVSPHSPALCNLNSFTPRTPDHKIVSSQSYLVSQSEFLHYQRKYKKMDVIKWKKFHCASHTLQFRGKRYTNAINKWWLHYIRFVYDNVALRA